MSAKFTLNKKGFLLIWVYLVIAVLLILGSALVARTINDNKIATRSKQATQAFELAEAGIDRALRALRGNFTAPRDPLDNTLITMGIATSNPFALPSNVGATPIIGQYRYRIDNTSDSNVTRIRAMGYVPHTGSPVVTRWVEVYVEITQPPGSFFNNTIWTTGNVTLNGTSYNVNGEATPDGIDNDQDGSTDEAGEGGNVCYGTSIVGDPSNIDGTEDKLLAGTKFYYLNFDTFKEMATTQGYFYTTANLADKTYMKDHPFPTTFWNPSDPSKPNVVYLEGDLDVSGNIGLGGIFIVAKDVIASAGSAEIGGTIDVNGIIYSLGNIKIHGTVDLSGAVWGGSGGVELDGNVDLGYNYTYINTFKSLIQNNPSVNIRSWHEPSTCVDKNSLVDTPCP